MGYNWSVKTNSDDNAINPAIRAHQDWTCVMNATISIESWPLLLSELSSHILPVTAYVSPVCSSSFPHSRDVVRGLMELLGMWERTGCWEIKWSSVINGIALTADVDSMGQNMSHYDVR